VVGNGGRLIGLNISPSSTPLPRQRRSAGPPRPPNEEPEVGDAGISERLKDRGERGGECHRPSHNPRGVLKADEFPHGVEVRGSLRVPLTEGHALFGQLPSCVLVLGQVRQTHTAEDVGGFGELDIVIADDLNAVAPWVTEVKEWALERGNARSLEGRRAPPPCRRRLGRNGDHRLQAVCALSEGR